MTLAANRDEFRARPSAEPAALGEGLFGGRDLRSGGTWLAVGAGGLAAVTNIRSTAVRDDARSRGELPLAALCGELPGSFEAWNPFNLLIVDARGARVVTHVADGEPARVTPLAPGGHVIVNEPCGARCPRAAHATAVMGDAEPDFRLLADHGPPGDAGLCHHGRDYGTVSSTVIRLEAGGRVATYHHCPGQPCRTPIIDLGDVARRVTSGRA